MESIFSINKSNQITRKCNDINTLNQDIRICISSTYESLPVCSVIDKIFININDEGYETKTELTDLFDKSVKYESVISSAFKNNSLIIKNPFSEMNVIGNEIALFLLLKRDILTLHASAGYINGKLFLFCGKSNSGKTTCLDKLSNEYANAKKVCDDHLHIKIDSNNLYFSTPIWDPLNTKQEITEWQLADELHIFDLSRNGSTINKVLDLCQIVIGMTYHTEISFCILNYLDRMSKLINKKIFMHRGKYQDYSSVQKILGNIIMPEVKDCYESNN